MERENPIAEFAQTVTLREGLKPEEGGTWGVVQAKDVGHDGELDLGRISRVRELPLRAEPPLLRANDVILQSRGTSYRSGIVPVGAEKLVAGNGVYALRPHVDNVDPRYLVMYFNLPSTQSSLRQIATGTHILNIRRDALNGFLDQVALELPPIEEQRRLVVFGEAMQRANEIEGRLRELRLRLMGGLVVSKGRAPPNDQ